MMVAGAPELVARFAHARERGGCAFIPYLMAGDPDRETTAAIIAALRDCGADAIELGIPYGDPLADGPTVAAAAMRALRAGTTIDDVLAIVARVRDAGAPPVVLFTYYNPVVQYGLRRFARAAAAAGAAGVIVPDLSLEEASEMRAATRDEGLAFPMLIAPTTPPDRARRIVESADGFVYVVSRLGVTGTAAGPERERLERQLATLRAVTSLPLAVGFGIARADQVRALAAVADGVVVGSALIDAAAGLQGASAAAAVRSVAAPLIAAAARG